MNVEELEEALDELFPKGFSIETDSRGRLVIHTGMVEGEDGELNSYNPEEEEEEFDEDTEPLDDEDLDDE